MANDLGSVVTKYTKILDEVVESETKTADLNMNQDLIGEWQGAGEIKIAKLAMDGLGDYSRTNGFAHGDVNVDWETKLLAYDRGREFSIDDMDDQERLEVVSMNAMSTFSREKVIPEIDAIRFARLHDAAGTKVVKTFTGATAADDAVAAVLAAEEVIEDKGVSLSECILYCTANFKGLLRQGEDWHITNGDGGVNTNITYFDEMKIVTVPQDRFYSKINTLDGTTSGEEDGGYEKDEDGVDLNFILIHPKAAAAIQRHEKLRYFDPDTNQDADAHKWQYRIYHDLITYDNKASLIYVSKKA